MSHVTMPPLARPASALPTLSPFTHRTHQDQWRGFVVELDFLVRHSFLDNYYMSRHNATLGPQQGHHSPKSFQISNYGYLLLVYD